MAVLKKRGRPRGETDTRDRIIAAALEEFGERGYDAATIRGIAARAEVDSALVHHYFGTKADLFAEAMDVPLRPDIAIPKILSGPRNGVGERVVRFVLEAFERPEIKRRGVALLRSAVSSKLTTPMLSGFLSRELLGRVARELDAEDAELRAALVASQMGGLLMTRYVLKLGPIADAKVDDLVDRIGPTVQRYLFD